MKTIAVPSPASSRRRLEWPSIVLAAVIHAGWLTATFYANMMAWWVALPIGAWLIAWHMSLQHEVIHGHPTRLPWLNDLLGSLPISLWLPYHRYKASHLGHHRGETLTDPIDDPESHYITADRYARSLLPERLLLRANNTLLGRLTVGPLLGQAVFLTREARLILAGDGDAIRGWLVHLPGLALVVAWLTLVCHLSLLSYVVLFVYPGYSLALVRSFAEHRSADAADHRTAIVERTPILGLLFLNNNLHVVHHLQPGLPWYRIPAAYRADRAALLQHNGGLVYRGYLDVARRYLLRQHHDLVHRRELRAPAAIPGWCAAAASRRGRPRSDRAVSSPSPRTG
ncbi:fatty acid desaturase [Lichenicola sp.]|uniref:fatty acid desaturase n=1 Tax=Lichenicola sp. TaxID=2804529 RepID=UPI003B00A2CC